MRPRVLRRLAVASLLCCLSCSPSSRSAAAAKSAVDPRLRRALAALDAAGADPAAALQLPAGEVAAIRGRIEANSGRFLELLAAVEAARAADPLLLKRVDKGPGGALGETFIPPDLVALDGTGLSVSRPGHRLRRPAFEALEAMDAAARAEGVVLLVSSSYRSYAYQKEVFARNVAQDGLELAKVRSAEPGRSQHQLGTAIDFGSIDDSFADTKAGRWLSANARRFGFSLSYPKGMEAVTGYVWESWHYRFIGKAAAWLEAEFFGGVQARMLVFFGYY